MVEIQNGKYVLPEDKWEQSYYTYVGNVFDAPEHQAILSKMTNIDDRIAYKRKISQKIYDEYLKHN